ncbi:MAG TPA: hypothetical protein VFU89_06980 [Rhabdochlamydiaceae bacterium]|nr:hypothetical protein [Rhabdochlamydiaceae bacterium]
MGTKPVSAPSVQAQEFKFPDKTGAISLTLDIFNLIWTTFLDPVSSIALAFTCRDFKQIINLLLSESKFCEKAAELGYLELVKWGVDYNCRWTSLASYEAAKRGCLPILQWAWDQGFLGFEKTAIGAAEGNQSEVLEWLWGKGAVPNSGHANTAASHGHIKLFQDLKSKLGDGYVTPDGKAIHPTVTDALIKSGNLTALEALFEEMDDYELEKKGQSYLNLAAEVGNLESLRFLLNLNIVDPNYNEIVTEAACHGQIKILDYIFSDLHKKDAFAEEIAKWAAQEEQWHIIRWLIAKDMKGNKKACIYAASHNRGEELELMHIARWPMANKVCQCAAVCGHWELVKHLIGKGLLCEEALLYFCAAKQGKVDLLNDIKEGKLRVASPSGRIWNVLPVWYCGKSYGQSYMNCVLAIGAAWSGNIEALEWVEKQGFEWQHEHVVTAAVLGGNIEILKWLFQKNCPYQRGHLYHAATVYKHFHILEWLTGFSLEIIDIDVSVEVAKNGKKDLLTKLVAKGCPVNAQTIEAAAFAGHWDIVDWLNETGCSWNIAFFKKAAEQGKEKILSSCLRQYFNEVNNPMRTFDFSLLHILAQYGYWKIFKDTVTTCIDKGIPSVLQYIKSRGYEIK